ncbi:MAG TPA: hypothetical protein VFR58_06685 [Flavisolibacter sp.]|nr:hypothetical protein [Flavisolibacter sp.]
MKRIVFILAMGLSFLSCKKQSEEAAEKKILLSEVRVDGLLNLRFSYNDRGLPVKLESFDLNPGNNSVASYAEFQYNENDQIKQYFSYTMPGNASPVAKTIVQYNEAGKLSNASFYDLQSATPNSAYITHSFVYNNKGQLSTHTERNANGQLTVRKNLSYYDNGHLKEIQEWKENGGQLWMFGKTLYSRPDGNYPSGLEQLSTLLGADFIARMYSDAISNLNYSQIGVNTKSWNAQITSREFNGDGTLKRQTTTHKFIKPVSDDKVFQSEFSYISR